MYLPAITLGYAVPAGDFDASIHSVFHSAMNIRLLDGHLLTLLSSSEANLPQGIRIDTAEDFSFEKFQIGETAVCREGILCIENPGLTVQLRGGRRWDFDLSKLDVDAGNLAVSNAWSLVWAALNRRQKRLSTEIIAEDLFCADQSIQPSVSTKAGLAMQAIVMATRQFNLDGTAAAEALIGLGYGLTPSGDDLLIGYLAGLWCTARKKSDRTQFTIELGKKITDLSVRTNDISRTYLLHAARGQVSSRLTALAEAIARKEKTDLLLEKAEYAMQSGSSSGMDVVTGLLIGMSAWDTPDLL